MNPPVPRIFFIVIVIALMLASCAERPITAAEFLDLGEKYLLEMDYEQALLQFTKVIEIEPMNPRGYTGAAEAYIGLGDTEKAEAILRQGLDALPNNEDITEMFNTLLPLQENTPAPELTPANEPKSINEIAEQEPWRLFDNPLSANEIVFAGVPFWECNFDIVRDYYPDGAYSYKDAEGVVRDANNNVEDGDMAWDMDYSVPGFQYAVEGDRIYGGFYDNSGIRDISMGMSLDEVMNAIGLSAEGVEYVAESEKGVAFFMDDSGCTSVAASEYPSRDFYFRFGFNLGNSKYMWFVVCFNEGAVSLIEVQIEKSNS